MTSKKLFGGIEAGGTKFICVVGDGPNNIAHESRFLTTTPMETLEQIAAFFRPYVTSSQIKSIGLGTFGPLDTGLDSPTYGFITSTPKLGWRNTDIVGSLRRRLEINIAFDSDVNAAALGEFTWGASQAIDASLYITIGTGIGGGFIKDGKPLHGLVNTEMGHIRIPHAFERDPFPGSCLFHGDCFEGLASGPAIQQRFDESAEAIPDDDPFWDLEAGYIASALMNYILILAPKKIILGGGVMQRAFLFPIIRKKVQESLNGYIESKSLLESIDDFIVPPALGNRSGVLGALVLAMRA